MEHIVCYSGGHSSALTAIEVARQHGTEDLVLVNHDIHPSVEAESIKRFKREVAAYIGVPITYANMPGWDTKDQFQVAVEASAFKVDSVIIRSPAGHYVAGWDVCRACRESILQGIEGAVTL
jgi:hypothetical protein